MKKYLVLACAAVLALTSPLSAAPPDSTASAWVEATLERLTLREKVAQMVMPWISGGSPERGSPEWERARRLVVEEAVGGVIVGEGRAQGTAFRLNELQRLSDVPLLVAADLEWGAGTRLFGATVLPINMAIGAAGGPRLAREAGRITALEARAAGIHMAFAPVADVNSNPDNPVINTRSYGADPHAVAQRVAAFIEGARAGGLLTVAKHFPGHGDTEVDSHLRLPVVDASRERLARLELVPFRAAIRADVAGIMTAHLLVPALVPNGTLRPATLSPRILTGLLRRKLSFDGLIVTDALIMGAVQSGRPPGRAAVAAVRAGADILLMPPDAAVAIDSVVAAVRSGRIERTRIRASVRRILAAKTKVGLHRERTVDLWALPSVLAEPANRRWAQRVAQCSITLVRHDAGTLPLALDRGPIQRVLNVVYDDGGGGPEGGVFERRLRATGAIVRTVRLTDRSTEAELEHVARAAAEADVVLFSSYAHAVPWKGTLGLPPDIAALADRLAAGGAIVLSFGTPYLLEQIPRARTYLLAWSEADVMQRAAARAVLGESPITGTLPIPLPPHHDIGHGLTLGVLAESEPAGGGEAGAASRER